MIKERDYYKSDWFGLFGDVYQTSMVKTTC